VTYVELMARIGECAVSRDPAGRLTALGLGSCIGLAVVDRRGGVAGLGHIVLAEGTPLPGDPPVKFASSGVPYLVRQIVSVGGRRSRLEAVLVGGASMFSATSSMEVGLRNTVAVRRELERVGIPIVAEATGGTRGRTVRVYVGERRVTTRAIGAAEEELMSATDLGAVA
jgi:chemotaxis protein CheD